MSEWLEFPGGLYKSKEDLYRDLNEEQQRIMRLGDPKILERRRQAGALNARERLDYLFDEGHYTEIGMHIKHRTVHFGMDKAQIPAEGVITAMGKVNGHWVVAFSEDFSSMAGSFGEFHGKIQEIPGISRIPAEFSGKYPRFKIAEAFKKPEDLQTFEQAVLWLGKQIVAST